MKYVALDFETANASPISACAIGISVFEDQTLLHSFDSFIKPPAEFGAFTWYNTKVHGITKGMVRNAPSFDELWVSLQSEIEHAVLVCHNAAFDTSVLQKTLQFYQIPVPNCRYICTVKVAQKVWPSLINHKLDTVSAALDIPLTHHHADSDALACGLILQKAMQALACTQVEVFAQKIGMRLGSISPNGGVSCSTAQGNIRAK